MECARGFVVEAEDNLGGLAHRPIAQRNQRGIVVALQLKHIAIGQRNLQIPPLDIAKKPYANLLKKVERLVYTTTTATNGAKVVAERAEEGRVRPPHTRTNGTKISTILYF